MVAEKVEAIVVAGKYEIDLEQVLEAAGVPDADGQTQVDESEVLKTLGIEALEQQEINRAALPPSIKPRDKSKLVKIVEWAREKRGSGGLIPDDAKPTNISTFGGGKVKYELCGKTFVMQGTDFVMAQRNYGKFNGIGSTVQVSNAEKQQKAQELKEIMSKMFPNCDLCGLAIEDYGPERAMIEQMLRGGVLRESGLQTIKGNGEFHISYRRMHVPCRFWDQAYQDLATESVTNPELDLEEALQQRVDKVMDEINDKRRDDQQLSRLEVLELLGTIDSHLRLKFSTKG